MFYEFSIQYDDPVVSQLLENSTIRDVLYFNVTHAYPNWIPPTWPKFVPPNTKTKKIENGNDYELFKSPFFLNKNFQNFNFEYRRYTHLCHVYLDYYMPSNTINSPADSFVSSVIRILSPFVPQGNFTVGENPPNPSEFFYRHFPKQSPDLDNDYHVRNPGVFWGWFYLSRWLPDLIQKLIFPLDGVIYDDKIDNQYNKIVHTNEENNSNKNNNNKLSQTNEIALNSSKFGRKLHGKSIPTKLECQLCNAFKGSILWTNNNEWFCIYNDKLKEIQENNKFLTFNSFSDLINWKTKYTEELISLEKRAYCAKNLQEMKDLEDQIYDLKSIAKQSNWIKNNFIVSIKG